MNNKYQSYRSFGEWVAAHRQRRRLGVRGLAALAGISHATISKIEDSRVGASREMVLKIADALEADRAEAVTVWLADETQDGGAVEITYETDPDSIPIPEGYNDDDFAVRSAATKAAQDAYRAVADAIRNARRESPGTIGFGRGRYEDDEQSNDEGDASTDEADTP